MLEYDWILPWKLFVECNKTVTVPRTEGEFGFRIHGSRPVVVSAIEPGTPAETSGLAVGDILLTVNGVNVLDLPHSQVVRVAQRCSEALELGVARTDDVMDRVSVWSQLNMSKEVMAQGYMLKRKRTGGSGLHQWVSRWFVLRADDCLYSFKSENVRSHFIIRDCHSVGVVSCRVYSSFFHVWELQTARQTTSPRSDEGLINWD